MSLRSRFRSKMQRPMQGWDNIKRALQFTWKSSPRWTLANLGLMILRAVLPLLSLYTFKLILDYVSVAITSPNKEQALVDVIKVIVMAGIVAWLSNLAQTIGNFVTQVQSQVVADYMYKILQAKSIEMDLAYYEDPQYHDSLHRAQEEASYRPLQIVSSLVQVGQNALSLVLIAGLIVILHWAVAIIMVFAVIPSILVRLRYSRKSYEFERKHTILFRRSMYFNWMLTTAEYAKEVRIFSLGTIFSNRFQELRRDILRSRTSLSSQRLGWELIAQTIASITSYCSYGLIAYLSVLGVFTLGTLVIYYQAFQRGQSFLQDLLGSLATLYENTLFLNNLYEFLDLKSNVPEPKYPVPVPKVIRSGIKFENVSFQYPRSPHQILKNVNLEIRPGEVIALVGENGSGKTTLVKLLCRLYDTTEGCITVDNTPLNNFSTHDWRKSISVIFQDYAHYNLSVRENIGFGNSDGLNDESRIKKAAQDAGADEVIANLSHGYDTVLGRFVEDGEELSVGQWQKIALARAFLRETQIIVLDEPTSALDPKAEYEVFNKLRTLLKGRSAIIISHRLATVRMADQIYVLQNGQIAEHGTHDELMINSGIYASLFLTQAQNYA